MSEAVNMDKPEVLIVGGGAAGSVFAAHLAQQDRSVVIFEAGDERKKEELYSSQVWARRLKNVEQPTPFIADDPGLRLNRGEGTGGTALHHYAIWPRYHPEDFFEHSQYGKAMDWPIGYEDLRLHYDRIQKEVGIAGDAVAEKWRPQGEPYPLPPVLLSEHGRTIARGFEKLDMHTAPLPMAVLTRPYNGRDACLWDGWCDAGCPTGALANPLVTYLPIATKAGAQIKTNVRVSKLIIDNTTEKVLGVEYFENGERKEQYADLVILSAFVVENVRILLNSRMPGTDYSVGNKHDLVGRYLMTHPSLLFTALFEGEDIQNYLGTTGGQLLCQDAYDKIGKHKGFGSRQWNIAMAVKPNDIIGLGMSRSHIFGKALQDFMQKAAHGMGNMIGMVEDQPVWENRIELSGEKDANGVPAVHTNYRVTKDALLLIENMRKEGHEVLKLAGSNDVMESQIFSQHMMGGTIMGSNESNSVADSFGRVHGMRNLYIGGASLFPTSSCVNSTYTIHALADRSARFISKNWSQIV